MTSPVTDSRVPPLGSLGPSPSSPLGGIPPGPNGRQGIHYLIFTNQKMFHDKSIRKRWKFQVRESTHDYKEVLAQVRYLRKHTELCEVGTQGGTHHTESSGTQRMKENNSIRMDIIGSTRLKTHSKCIFSHRYTSPHLIFPYLCPVTLVCVGQGTITTGGMQRGDGCVTIQLRK